MCHLVKNLREKGTTKSLMILGELLQEILKEDAFHHFLDYVILFIMKIIHDSKKNDIFTLPLLLNLSVF